MPVFEFDQVVGDSCKLNDYPQGFGFGGSCFRVDEPFMLELFAPCQS